MPTKPENMTDAEWNALDEVARMRAAKQHEDLDWAIAELTRTCEEIALLIREETQPLQP